MSLNSLSGTSGYYYPGMFDSGSHGRNKHVGGFNNDDAYGSNANAASQSPVVNTSNLTQNAPQATGAAQSVGQSGGQGNQASLNSSSLSPDFQSEENVLSNLMDKSLEAMNVISPSDASGTQINFTGLSYDVSSSTTAAAGIQGNQVGASLDESQSATLEGEGQLVTPDGTTYDFTIELQVGNDQQASASAPLQSGGDSSSNNALSGLSSLLGGNSQSSSSSGATSATSATSPSNYLAQLVNAMTQSASQAYGSDPNSFLQSSAPTSASTSGTQATSATSSGSTSAQPSINWDAIQKQTSSLIDMLDAMISTNQSTAANSASNANAASANAAAMATSAAATQQANSTNSNNTTAAVAA